MTSATCYRFGDFRLDTGDRQLWKADERVDLNARYLDALSLLLEHSPGLVEKHLFFERVWTGMVVSDSALSQCIKELRKVLDDDAASPRLIQTVPRHGYRFIGPVEQVGSTEAERLAPSDAWSVAAWNWVGWTAGGALAGLIGGLLYGFGLSSSAAGIGTLSTLMVLIALNVLVGTAGGAGIGLGITCGYVVASRRNRSRIPALLAGGALGGLLVGATANMLGIDAFNLLFGKAPSQITGAFEGAALGAAVVVGMVAGEHLLRGPQVSQRMAGALGAGSTTAFAGFIIPLAGGHLMGGSLRLLAESFSDSQLHLETFTPLFGQLSDSIWAEATLAGMEGLIFGGCLVGTWGWMQRRFPPSSIGS